MIFTSGSTGRPKGVVISHQNLMYSTAARIAYYPESPQSFLLLSSFAFDSSVAGIFWTLCTGGSLVLPGEGKSQDIHNLELQISQHKVSHTLCLPSIYTLLLRYANADALKSLNTVIVAGEVCPSALPALSHKELPSARLYNEYGPTEATVWSTVAKLHPDTVDTGSLVPIGHPIPGTRVRVVNKHGETCAPGVSGELLVTGPGVAKGYYGDTPLSRSRFSSPEDGSPDAANLRTYKTGDLVTLGYNGQLYFLGRTDHQLKIRGHRIEAGEITSRTERHPEVLEAVCLLQDFTHSDVTHSADKRLVCFYTLKKQPGSEFADCHLIEDPGFKELTDDIQVSTTHLIKQELPAQFAVFRFAAINRFPRLPNGKINLDGFPSMSDLGAKPQSDFSDSEMVTAPVGVEAELCELLAKLLDIPAIPPGENFFTLGGDSLTAIRFVAAARELGIPLTVPMITAYATVSELANAPELHDTSMHQGKGIVPYGESPLSPIQRWFFSVRHSQTSHWNMAFIVALKDTVSVEDITEAIFKVVEDFPILGASFVRGQGDYMQCIPATIEDESLVRKIAPPESHSEWINMLSSAQIDFDLESGIVMRFLVAANEEQDCLQFGVVVHHLVTDALSNWYISKRIVQLLRGEDGTAHGGVSPLSYREWSMLLQQEFPIIVSTNTVAPELTASSWTEDRVNTQSLEVSNAHLPVIRQFCDQQSMALHEYFLFLLLSSGCFTSETRVDIETHGRDLLEPAVDASAAVGWFTSFFPVMVPPLHGTELRRFSDILRHGKKEKTDQFARDPVNFFDRSAGASQPESGTQPMPLLYNYLAMDVTGSDQMEVRGFHVYTLDRCLFSRQPQSQDTPH